jgi:autotransporter-associated beta strand protein
MQTTRVTGTDRRLIWLAICCLCGGSATAQSLPPPVTTINSFPPVAKRPDGTPYGFSTALRFGPDGLIYAWDCQNVWRQSGVNVDSFGMSPFGTVRSNGADAGPINFSQDGQTLLIGNGAGGTDFGGSDGTFYTMPATGGAATPVGTVFNHFDAVPAPIASTAAGAKTKFLVDSGSSDFSTSEVDLFDCATGAIVPIVRNIPGASSSIAFDASNRLYVGVGFGTYAGQIRRFALPLVDLAAAGASLDWNQGQLINNAANNSGNGMVFDARGYLLVGGSNGVAVFNASGASQLYGTGPDTLPSVAYNATNDQVAITPFASVPSIYHAGDFTVSAMPLAIWNADTAGNWSNGANWNSAAAPNGIDQQALLGGTITAPRTITLDAPVTLGSLTFDSPQKYLVGGSNALAMQASSAIATIDVATGSHEIAAPLILASDTDITVANAADTLTLSGGVGGSGMLSKEGSGTLTIAGPNSYAGNTAVDGGKLRFQVTMGSATVANGAIATVAAGATLELAGAVSALGAAGGNRAHVINDGAASALLVTGTSQVVGGIDGSGETIISAGSDLTADHIIQSALVIGGNAMSHSVLTIAPSDANGQPLMLTESQAPDAPFEAAFGKGLNAATIDAAAIRGSAPLAGEPALAPTAVPEPGALSLAVIAAMLVAAASSRRACE